jgi:SNF family Na+-dependent transporter
MNAFKKLLGYNSDWTVIKVEGVERDRWQSNTTFILASIGCAIGLGNLWRFPYLCYKWGGATFFIPYLMCLFFLGIPMLLLEFTLGQVLQKGNILAWSMIHPRLYGIGLATCTGCYLIVLYYNVIISWALLLFFASFKNPLPWSTQNTADVAGTYKECPKMFISEEQVH